MTVPIELVSQGIESSISFTVLYDSSRLSNAVVAIGSGVPAGATLGINDSQIDAGRVGIMVDSNNTFTAGIRQIVTIRFDILPSFQIGFTPVDIGNTPVPQAVVDAEGALLPTMYEMGGVQIAMSTVRVDVSGRVLTPDGRGLRNAVVTLIDASGHTWNATTGSFGNYTFEGIQAGGTYLIGVSSRKYRYAPRALQVVETLVDLNFIGLE